MIEHGAEINQMCNGINTATLIIQKVPEVMTHLLDQSVAYDQDDNSKLKVDFKVLLQAPPPPSTNEEEELKASAPEINTEGTPSGKRKRPKSQREMEMIEAFLKCSPPIRDALLTHPLTATFLHLKWGYIRKWFWFIRGFYTTLAILYTYFIFKLYLLQCPYNDESHASEDYEGTCDVGLELFIVAICIGSWLGLILVTSSYAMVHNCKSYWTAGLNLGWWILIGTVTLNILPAFGILNKFQHWQYFASAFGLFYTWVLTLWYLSQLPVFGVCIKMFAKVLQRVAVTMITISSLFIAFAFGFAILFKKSSYFKDIPMNLLRLFLLMMGDHEYETIFNNDEQRLSTMESTGTHLYYLAFIVVFGIAVTNLLIALAVRDVRELDTQAEFVQISNKIEGISQMESLVADNWISNCIQNYILSQISVFCRNGRYFRFSPMDLEDKTLPGEIKMKFLPLLHTRDCLNKRDLMAQQVHPSIGLPPVPGLHRNDHFRGSGHSHYSTGRPSPDNIEQIVVELKQKLEGLQQQRRRFVQRSNPIFC